MPTISDPAWFERFDDHCRRVTRPIALLGVIGMLIVSGATMLDVILRWTVDSSVVALNEIVGMVFAVTITACLPYGVASRVNLKLDLFEGWIKGRLGAWVDAAGMVLVLIFLCILTWRLALEAQTMADTNRLTTILRWPTAPFLYAVTTLLAVAALVQAVVTVAEIRRAMAYVWPAADAEASVAAWVFVLVIYGVTAVIFAYGVFDLPGLAKFAANHPGTTLTIICILMWLLLRPTDG